jgi:acyl carrier protein phosphodiesterase
MNYLAHCALAGAGATRGPAADLVVGGYLGDFLKGAVPPLPGRVGLGVQLHRRIDAMTQDQPDIRQSVARFGADLRRTAPIFVDLVADHFLARSFERYYPQPVDSFSLAVYQTLNRNRVLLPPSAQRLLDHMRRIDLMAAYRDIDVLARACLRIGERLRMPEIGPRAVAHIKAEYDGLAGDFAAYYPSLQRAVAAWLDDHEAGSP